MKFGKSAIAKLPRQPGVYAYNCFPTQGYIGSTKNLRRRTGEHLREGKYRGCELTIIPTKTKNEARKLERELIKKYCPSDNKLGKKSCPPSIDELIRGFLGV